MKKDPEISRWKMKIEEKRMKKKGKKSWILYLFIELKKKNRKQKHFSSKERSKESNTLKD